VVIPCFVFAFSTMPPLLFAARVWPDGIDQSIIVAYVAIIVGLPVFGYVLAYIDWRAQYRRLRRALVLVSHYSRELPAWVRRDAPPCLQAFDLRVPFTQAELLAAYRQRVKQSHPDRGGDRKKFLQLQQFFEQAMPLAEDAK
jgi:hypothetical protein